MLYCSYSRILPLVAAIGLFVLCVPSLAQVQLSKSTKAAHDVFLEGYARTNDKCESIDPPAIYVEKPPKHGIICSRDADLLLRKTVDVALLEQEGTRHSRHLLGAQGVRWSGHSSIHRPISDRCAYGRRHFDCAT